ncbi:MAG: helix-turn-helix domain-containing protein [Halapricum sp.]
MARNPELSDEQRELLKRAVREGYFEVPRRTTLVSLAEKQGVSDVEASEQLRDGIDGVLRNTVFEEDSFEE